MDSNKKTDELNRKDNLKEMCAKSSKPNFKQFVTIVLYFCNLYKHLYE